MYFASRMQAGRMLAAQLAPKYQGEQCAVVALSDGGVVVGAQIAMALHAVLSLLLTKEITLPHELEAVAAISQDGSVSFNRTYSPMELDELIGEYYQYIEQEKLELLWQLNDKLGSGNTVDKKLLANRTVILVTDGLRSGFSIDMAVSFLKTVPIRKLVAAVPLASVPAVDRLHVTVDDIYCLSVVENYISTNHYYDTQDVPPHEQVIDIMESITKNWQ